MAGGTDLRVVAGAAQQPVGDTRCAARAGREQRGAVVVDGDLQQSGAAPDDVGELADVVVVEPEGDPEAVTQRTAERARRVLSRRSR